MRFPDFIIIGAMKAGTTSLHHMLAGHPDVFIPNKEIFFFDIDDRLQHPDFPSDKKFISEFNYEENFENLVIWYSSFFNQGKNKKYIGEDTTTYLSSFKAPSRIRKLLPDVKLLILLRDPVKRAYSHYWHLLGNGLALNNFENTIFNNPGTILQRGEYKKQIEIYYNLFEKKNIKVLIFEEFFGNIKSNFKDVLEFLDIPSCGIEIDAGFHLNRSRIPRNTSYYIYLNKYLNKFLAGQKYYEHFQFINSYRSISTLSKKILRLNQKLFLSENKIVPQMSERIKLFLQDYYNNANRGLSSLLNIELKKYWDYFTG